MYDYLIVGAGLAGATFARCMTDRGYNCLIVERRMQIGGNLYSSEIEGIEVHQYGPHIFHTANERVWTFINRFASFNHFVYSPLANYYNAFYSLPFNMHTFYQLWQTKTPDEARAKIAEQIAASGIIEARNLEEQAILLVGKDIYEKLIRGYTEKQWGRPCRELPAFIIQRLPVRFTYDNNYFNHPHQGIPIYGYTAMLEEMLKGIDIELCTDYLKNRNAYHKLAKRIVYTGPIDAYYGYCYGALAYRSLRFETEVVASGNYQGVATINYTDDQTPYTRIIEHKHFQFGKGNPEKTVLTKEYPIIWKQGDEPYYPVNDIKNNTLYQKYRIKAEKENNLLFIGRLGLYRYFDMDQVIDSVLQLIDTL